MKRLLNFLINPFVLSILPAVIIIYFLPFNYDRFLLTIEQAEKLNENQYVWYEDITLDGNSERILIIDENNITRVLIHDNKGGLYNQWNFRGHIDFYFKPELLITGDYNDSGEKTLFFLTLSNDSIFLHAIHNLENQQPLFRDRFISTMGPGKGKPDVRFFSGELDDLDGDGTKELIFGLSGGFSFYPRSVFAYYIDQDSLVRSPESSYFLSGLKQVDITGDGKREIIALGSATANISPQHARYHDFSNWLMVLDHNLEFLFEPVELSDRTKGVNLFVTKSDQTSRYNVFLVPIDGSEITWLHRYDSYGGKVDSMNFPYRIQHVEMILTQRGDTLWAQTVENAGVLISNNQFNSKKNLPGLRFHASGFWVKNLMEEKQLVAIDYNTRLIYVFRNGLKQAAKTQIDWASTMTILLSIKESATKPPQLSLQLGRDHYLLSYGPNPAFYLNFLYFFLIYAGMLGFAFSSRSIQKRQIQKKLDTEKKITELQLSMVKNQLDPHFTMNAINSIIHSVNQNHKEKANENLHRFSRLYRSLLLSADSTRRSLEDELNFCRDYLELEKARFDNAFEFEINMAENLDLKQLVPKMIIQTHAENAVKHGLSAFPKGGKLRIDITSDGQQLEIEISDNGIGRQQAAKKAGTSTGKGLALMKEFYQLYKKYYKQDISADIQDVFDEEGKTSGTKVIIKISRCDERN
jgi:hypothetical protein